MKHIHHIIPKHMGGTNDPSNLIELTVEEHAEAHKLLWEQNGLWQDYYAWQGLAGIIPKQELIREIQRVANTGKFMSEETREKIRQANLGKKHRPETIEKNRQWHLGKKLTEEHKRKVGLARLGQKQTEYQKKTLSEKLSKTWSITNPSGNIIIIKNLRQFCKENNLDQGNMSRGGHKGWKCLKLEA
jgi:hypothetical protein